MINSLSFDSNVSATFQTKAKAMLDLISLHIPLAKKTYSDALKNGAITVTVVPANTLLSSHAHWDQTSRTIRISANASASTQLLYLLFEMCNAANPLWASRRNPLEFTSADAYADYEERIEFHSAKNCYDILNAIKQNSSLMTILAQNGITSSDINEALSEIPGQSLDAYMKAVHDKAANGLGYAHSDIYRANFDKARKLRDIQRQLESAQAKDSALMSAAKNLAQTAAAKAQHDRTVKEFKANLEKLNQTDFLAPYKQRTGNRLGTTAMPKAPSASGAAAYARPAVGTSTVKTSTTPTPILRPLQTTTYIPSAAESLNKIKELSKSDKAAQKFIQDNFQYYLGRGKCYLPDILKAAIDANLPEFIEYFIEKTKSLDKDDLKHLIKMFCISHGESKIGPIEYALKNCRFVINGYLSRAFSNISSEVLNALAASQTAPVGTNRSTSTTVSSTVSATRSTYTPSLTKAYPTYQKSMEIAKDLKNGYPLLAKSAFLDNKDYYLGCGQCYLPDILKGAIEGNQIEFMDLFLKEISILSYNEMEALSDKFEKLDGVNGNDPYEYAMSLYKYRIADRLKSAEQAAKKVAYR